MKVFSVKTYKPPSLPTRDLFVLHPKLLNAYVPGAWKGKKLVAGALLSFVLSGSSNTRADNPKGKGGQEQLNVQQQPKDTVTQNETKLNKGTAVAPLFVHGEGRGGTGCVMVSPPVFLSEEDARQIITEELAKVKITFDKKDVVVEEISFDKKRVNYGLGSEEKEEIIGQVPLTLDGYNTQSKIGFCFASTSDCGKYGPGYSPMGSVTSFDTRELAERIRDKIRDRGKINAVVFYDPIANIDYSEYRGKGGWDDITKVEKKQSVELLRAQVADFIQWAKVKGLFK